MHFESISRAGVILWLSSAMVSRAAPESLAFPEGTKVEASWPTEAHGHPRLLLDGDPKTFMVGQSNSVRDPRSPVWVDFVFPAPVANLAGIETGDSDPHQNYFPRAAQFWVDTDGNGTFDTLGTSAQLGPAAQSRGRHLFPGRLPKAHAVRFLVTEQNRAGLNRGFMMNEVRMVVDSAAPAMPTTPDRNVEAVLKEAAAARIEAERLAAEERRRNAPKLDESIVPGSEKLPGRIVAPPPGTRFAASFRTEPNRGPETLFDGDPETFITGVGGSCTSRTQPLFVTLRFPEPLRDLAGIETGRSCPFHNYYPIELEFRVDSNNDGRFDTLLGRTRNLGPADRAVGRHMFDGRLPEVWGLEIRSVEQNTAGGNRAWTMNEMRLVVSDEVPLAAATPNSYRVLTYTGPLPPGTTARASFATEEGLGPEALLDGDSTTFMNPKPGTAVEGQPASVYLRFPVPVRDAAGIRIGRTDPHGNYRWEEMEIWADTNGDGTYDRLAGVYSGGAEGVKRFRAPVAEAHGIELRVTRQTRRALNRAFLLNEVDGLVFADDPGDRVMRYVVEDFEDLSSWRVWADNTAQPPGERSYGGYTYICGVHDPEARAGQAVGRLRYCFKEPPRGGRNTLRAKRGLVTAQEAIADAIEFDANPQGYACRIGFELTDAQGRKVHTPRVEVAGRAWQRYRIDLSAAAWPTAAALALPVRIEHLFLDSANGGEGDVLLDDIAIIGAVSRDRRVSIKPVWEGLAYDPARPLRVKYNLRNALDEPLNAMLAARLYSSFDPQRKQPLAVRAMPVSLPKWGATVVEVDFGEIPYGHYEAELSLDAPGVAARHTDFIGVLQLNGGRVNRSPMWIGSMHPAHWLSDAENRFVFDEVVFPLGLDCYRVGAPSDRYSRWAMEGGLLLAAGAGGGLPRHLQKSAVPRPEVNEPNDYAAYAAWWKARAERDYAPFRDRIVSIEYFNEPDLPGFEFIPEIDVYLKMWRTWAAAMREVMPEVRLGTGGATVYHPNAKKDFNLRMYTELAREADVAIWHAHGPLNNYTTRHRQVEAWLRAGGRPDGEMLLGNSEAGFVSRNSAAERLAQADALVKKIGWAKAQANSLFYIWFTTTDTYDPQGGYLAGDNWGLIRFDQRLKASGQAMNEIVRRLANARGEGEFPLDERLMTLSFRMEDEGRLFLFWPHTTGARFLQNLSADGPVELSDLFGRSVRLTPSAGNISFTVNGYSMYLRAGPGVRVGPATAADWIRVPALIPVSPGARAAFDIGLTNTWGTDARVPLTIEDMNGVVVARAEATAPIGEQVVVPIVFDLPAGMRAGVAGYVIKLRDPRTDREVSLPLMAAVGEGVPRSARPLKELRPPERTAAIRLEGSEAVHDLVDDPQTPRWAGPEDLSVTARFAHDGAGLYLRFEVRDQTHRPGEPGARLWTGDSVQIGIAADGRPTEIGLTEAGGGAGWRWIAPTAEKVGELRTPLAASRAGDVTTYECYLPFADLGFEYRPGLMIRMTFLVNEDDGRGRVRLLQWFDGIHPGKDVERFGYLILD